MDTERTRFQIDLLTATAAAGDEPSGAEVRKWLMEESGTGYRDVGQGHLYHTLNVLVDCGYIEKAMNGKENKYAVTEDGYGLLRARYEQLERALS